MLYFSMALFYSSLDLHNLNSSYPLPVDIYHDCASLEMLRRLLFTEDLSAVSVMFASSNSSNFILLFLFMNQDHVGRRV